MISEEELQPAVDVMCRMNSAGEKFAHHNYVHSLTDVTGFGLLGHLLEMSEGSGLAAEINYASISLIEGAQALAKKYVAPDNTFRNWKSYEQKVSGINGESLITLCDPQTNGGLLVAVDARYENEFKKLLTDLIPDASVQPIGEFRKRAENDYVITLK